MLEIARAFLRLGLIAFGGPAAHVALMEDEFVSRRGWISRQHFLDLIGATNLIPGPNSTELTMHVGYERGGALGLFTAGLCFITPAALITGLFAWAYVEYGALPAVEPFLFGVKPAVLAVILGALWKLGKKAIPSWKPAVIAAAVAAAVFAGAGEVLALLVGGAAGMLWLRGSRAGGLALLPLLILALPVKAAAATSTMVSEASLWKLALFFLKVGAILYGSGYVLIAFLEGGLVGDYGWLTQQQLLDAIAVGQFTPGPLLTTSTFIGYLVAGVPGAAVATLGIFLPAFFFVWLLNPIVPRMRKSAWASAFLDAVNAAAVALMAVVTFHLGRATLISWEAWVIAAIAAILVLRTKLNTAWLVIGGAVGGWALRALG